MIIFLNNPKPFEAGVILRALYYSTEFRDIDLYINGKLNLPTLVRYSRVSTYEIKNKIAFDIPCLDGEVYVVDPKAKKTIFDIENIDGLIIDFSGEYLDRYEGIRGLGLNLLHYEAISILYYLFIRNYKKKVPKLKNKPDRISIYIARKLLEIIDLDFINPRKFQFILQHIHKAKNIVADVTKYRIEGGYKGYRMEYTVEFFDRRLKKIKEAKIILENGIVKIPLLLNNKEIEYREFYLDKDKRRVYITENFYIEESEGLQDFSKILFL